MRTLSAILAVCLLSAPALGQNARVASVGSGLAGVPAIGAVLGAPSGSLSTAILHPSGLQVGLFSTLPSLEEYSGLLDRQRGGETLDLSSLARPGIARSDGARLSVLQGSGRFEKLRSRDKADLFVPEGDPLPKGVTVLESGLDGKAVSLINQLSSRGQAGSNELLVDIMTSGKRYVRVLAPRNLVDAPMSNIKRDCEALVRKLAPLRKSLDTPEFKSLSLVEQKAALEKLEAR